MNLDGRNKADVKIGQYVEIVMKQDQSSGEVTDGLVMRILTKTWTHPHGIKVRLDTGEVGRVKTIVEDVND